MSINGDIKLLINYGIKAKLIQSEDYIYVLNKYLDLFKLDEYIDELVDDKELKVILNDLLDYSIKNGLVKEDSIIYRDLFDSKIMDILTPRPSVIIDNFNSLYKESPLLATDYFYKLSNSNNYIRNDRINRNIKWKSRTKSGLLEITINLSKPEKDPKIITLQKTMKSEYPKCLLCKENEGYYGRVNHPGRSNHRLIPIRINEEDWFLQYSPYVYFNEHSIVFSKEHRPMLINYNTFKKLLDFVELFPHYFIGSNADLPIVGGSILSHDHFQGGNHHFPIEEAKFIKTFKIKDYEDCEVGIVNWPMSVIRLRHENKEKVIELADYILNSWKKYSDESLKILSFTKEEPHNTITPIARFKDEKYELDLVLRNNITTLSHPDGLYHPHQDVHHIKKENIGLIEVMGLAVLPPRLKEELELLKRCLLKEESIDLYHHMSIHKEWFIALLDKYKSFTNENIDEIIQNEVALKFERCLIDAGVFKQDKKGMLGFERFINTL